MIPAEPPGGSYDPGSFRDPASRVFFADDDSVRRVLSTAGASDWESVARSEAFGRWMAAGDVVSTEELEHDGLTILLHERIPVWTYPYEWTFSMMQEAALLQLRLLDEALDEGLTFKDATPYNVQFWGSKPVFIDVGSIRPWEEGEPWLGYRQFCQLFLYPLLLRAHAATPFQPLLRGSLDGISAETARSFLRGSKVFKPGALADVVLHARAERSSRHRNVRDELGSAGFTRAMIQTNVRRLRKVVEKTTWQPSDSAWSEYAACDHVAGGQRESKAAFVEKVASEQRRRLVWDLGSNDGHHSRIVRSHADSVVAVDGDEWVLDRLYRALRSEDDRTITPLVMNLADPSPSLGWRGVERRRLEDRGSPDLVLALAVIHHLVVGANLPLTDVVDWLASLGAEVILEWVPPDDPLVVTLAANKKAAEIHSDYREDVLRALLGERFILVDEQPLDGRVLLRLQPLS